MDKTELQNALVAVGLSRLVQDIERITQPSLRLFTTPVDESTLAPGTSKLGGRPDLPPDIQWPQWKGLPQSFIAQIRLDDVHDGRVPAHGMLWFFYDARQETYGEDPADRGGWQVFFRENDLHVLRRATPPATLPATSQFNACSIRWASESSVTQQPQLEIPDLAWTDDDQEKYDQALAKLITSGERSAVHHRLLGFPDTIQDDMRQQCQLVSNGVTDGSDPRAADLTKGAQEWQLLLQVDSDDHANMHWANAGMLYYWIKRSDLQAQKFDQTWLVLQSE